MINPALSWNVVDGRPQLWAYPFMVNAFRAGAVVAVVAGVVGLVHGAAAADLRRPHPGASSAFPGAAGAVLIGIAASYGYFAFCIAAAAVIALATRGRAAGQGGAGSARSRR